MTRLTPHEKQQYEEHGFVVRLGALGPADVEALRRATEELCRDVEAAAGGTRTRVSQYYVFEMSATRDIIIKWEPGEDRVVQGLEPFAHLHPVFEQYSMHPALVEPSRDLLGLDAVGLFTDKLNVKRARVGGEYALHQDYPYWKGGVAEEPECLITAWLGLDDATADNGALEVLPGSHRLGEVAGRDSDRALERKEIDPSLFDTSAMVTVEAPAGTAIFFGPFLVHRSAANRSGSDRRAILYTYQRPGLRTIRENTRRWLAARGGRQ